MYWAVRYKNNELRWNWRGLWVHPYCSEDWTDWKSAAGWHAEVQLTTTRTPCVELGMNTWHETLQLGTATGYGLHDSGSGSLIPGGGWEFFSSPPRSDRVWGTPSLLSNGYWEWSGWAVKLTTHLLLVRRPRMRGTIPPPPLCLHGVVLS
jgi:hypothetical protein